MTNPGTYHDSLEGATGELDSCSKDIDTAKDELDVAEEEWLKKYDAVAENIEGEWNEKGRNAAPPEHLITSTTRRQHRAIFTRWSRAKRALKAAELKSANRRSELSGYQSLIKNENAEAGVQDHLGQRSTSRTPNADFHRASRSLPGRGGQAAA